VIQVRGLEPVHHEAWNALVAGHPASGFMQSWEWSRFKELEGYVAIRLGLFDGDVLRGGAIAYAFPSPAEAGLLVVPDGPVLDWDAPDHRAQLAALAVALRDDPAGDRAVALRVEPRCGALPPALRGLVRAPVDLVPRETLEVDLGPEAEMLARMKPKGRYNARLATRRGVEVVSSVDPADVHELCFVLDQTARYQDFLVEPKGFFINLVQSLVPGMGRFAFARYKGVTLVAALVVRHGGTVTYLYGGRLPLFPDVMASYALHWHLMREAARDGYRVYDFYGYVPPEQPGHPYDRFSRFKDKFGGRHVPRVGSWDLIFYDRLADAALSAMRAAPALTGRARGGARR
jgi:peptidoglycan pentaglycine glycine transferase (the first glycine)